jgi:hypothetical protein
MKLQLGAKEKPWKIYAAAGLGAVVLGLVIYNLHDTFSGGSASTPPPPPPTTTAVSRPSRSTASHSGAESAHEAAKLPNNGGNLDPTLHPELMAQAESLEYNGNGRNIFSLTSAPVEIPKPIKSVRTIEQAAVPTGPPPPQPPPPIDLKFFGYAARTTGTRRAFLLKGDDVFIASEGDVVDHRYKVVKIAPTSIQVEDIPYSNTQSLPLVQN